MEFQDFPMILGKSGRYEIHPPKLCASPNAQAPECSTVRPAEAPTPPDVGNVADRVVAAVVELLDVVAQALEALDLLQRVVEVHRLLLLRMGRRS